MSEFVDYILGIIKNNLESYIIKSYWEYEMYRISNVEMLPKNVSIRITYHGDYLISLELNEFPINISIYLGKIEKNGVNDILYNYDKILRRIIKYKEINEFINNFGPFDKINYNTYKCGIITLCNNDGCITISCDKKLFLINSIDDIITQVPEIYNYQIIKLQKLPFIL